MTDVDDEALGVIAGVFEASQRGALVIWTIYDKPRDHPDGFIARRFEVTRGGVEATVEAIPGDLDKLRNVFIRAGLTKMLPQDGDEPQIVESWL